MVRRVGGQEVHRTATLCNLGNLLMILGRKLVWDGVKQEVGGDPAANRMLSKRSILLLGVAIFVIACSGLLWFRSIGGSGTVENPAELQRVYSKAGPALATFYTNFVRDFPFSGPVAWRRSTVRSPVVEVAGPADSMALSQFIADHRGAQFLWVARDANGIGANDDNVLAVLGRGVNWGKVIFRIEQQVHEYQVVTTGEVSLNSKVAKIQSFQSEHLHPERK